MEGENNMNMGDGMEANTNQNPNMGMNNNPNMGGEEKKSGSFLWSIIAIVIVVLLGYLLVKSNGNSNVDTMPQDEINNSMMIQNEESMGTQSDSTDLNSIEADLEATNMDSLDVELQ